MNASTDARALIRQFNERHGLETKNQALMLDAETGELAEAILTGEGIREEIGDVLFVAISIAELEGIDPHAALLDVAMENSAKSTEKSGEKVTKA